MASSDYRDLSRYPRRPERLVPPPAAAMAALALLAVISAGLTAQDAAPATAREAFRRWLDEQAQAAIAEGARARAQVQSADAVRRRAAETHDRILALAALEQELPSAPARAIDAIGLTVPANVTFEAD